MMTITMPEDVFFQILVCVPVISLLRFNSICKSWCALIESSNFISQHYLHQNNINNLVVKYVNDWRDRGRFLILSGRHNFDMTFNLDLPPELPSSFTDVTSLNSLKLVASCNGVICVTVESSSDVILCNPATKQFRLLPESLLPKWLFECPLTSEGVHNKVEIGFGLDVKTNDYKVIRFIISDDSQLEAINTVGELYSLSSNSWRLIDVDDGIFPFEHLFFDPKAPYQNGTYCWFGRLDDYAKKKNERVAKFSILSFDFSDEVFRTIAVPDICSSVDVWRKNKTWLWCLGFVSENLACVIGVGDDSSTNHHFEIWVMNEFGIKESWSKQYTIDDGFVPTRSMKPTGILQNGDFLLIRMDGNLCLCDRVTYEIKDFLSGALSDSTEVADYKESLVLIGEKSISS